MSGSTGNPLNLNKFDGTDDVVKALTDLFNQNMDLINKGDVHVKVWQPNTVYQKADVIMHPYQPKLMYSYVAHTSSNSTNEADWGANDGSKWGSLSFTPNVIGWQANNYFQYSDIFFDGNELKRAMNSGASSTLDRTASSFVGSRIANWTPNTKYNVGDLAYIGQLNTKSEDGVINSGIMRCISAHTSEISFPASSAGQWELTNREAWHRTKDNPFIWGTTLTVRRTGNTLSLGFYATSPNHNIDPGSQNIAERLPDWADLLLNGNDAGGYISQSPWYGNAGEWMISLHNNASNSNAMRANIKITPGSLLRGNSTFAVNGPIAWESNIPTF